MLVTSKRVAVCEDRGPKGPRLVTVFYFKQRESISAIELAGPTFRLGCGRQAGLSGDLNGLWILVPGPPPHRPGLFPGPQWAERSRKGRGEEAGAEASGLPCSLPGGLCNLCSDRANKEHILQTGGVPLIINCLSSPNEETVLSAVTTIMYLSAPGPASHPELTAMPVVQCMLRFSLSANTRLRNLAQIFLEDFCSPSQVAEARRRPAHSALGIPLPRTEAPQQP